MPSRQTKPRTQTALSYMPPAIRHSQKSQVSLRHQKSCRRKFHHRRFSQSRPSSNGNRYSPTTPSQLPDALPLRRRLFQDEATNLPIYGFLRLWTWNRARRKATFSRTSRCRRHNHAQGRYKPNLPEGCRTSNRACRYSAANALSSFPQQTSVRLSFRSI